MFFTLIVKTILTARSPRAPAKVYRTLSLTLNLKKTLKYFAIPPLIFLGDQKCAEFGQFGL